MGNNRRSKVNRLPKAERRVPSKKISVLCPQEIEERDLALALANSISTSQPQDEIQSEPHFYMWTTGASSSATTYKSEKIKIKMDDEALTKVLSYAGLSATLAARDVCLQWRRVANEVLSNVTRVDLSKLYIIDGQRVSAPTDIQILRTLHALPNLKGLTVRSWPFSRSLLDINDIICTGLFSTKLIEVEFSGVFILGEAIVQLLQNCSSLSILKLGSHDSINDDALSKIISYWLSKPPGAHISSTLSEFSQSQPNQPRLTTFSISNTRTLTGDALSSLLLVNFAWSIIVSKCHALNDITHQAPQKFSTNILSITNSANLRRFQLVKHGPKRDVQELNLSQCPNLREITIRPSRELSRSTANKVLELRKLMLSGCQCLRNIRMREINPITSFSNLEEIVLFGARNLDSSIFSSVFGLSSEQVSLPKLRRLELNGCSVDSINLVGYLHLTSAAFSGCWNLKRLNIADCWKLERFVVSGSNIPLESANIVLPVSCDFEGKGREWHWQKFESHQLYAYP